MDEPICPCLECDEPENLAYGEECPEENCRRYLSWQREMEAIEREKQLDPYRQAIKEAKADMEEYQRAADRLVVTMDDGPLPFKRKASTIETLSKKAEMLRKLVELAEIGLIYLK